jgi:hypothetical protein
MDSNYPQFVDAAENPRAGVFHQVMCTSCIIICSPVRTSISLYDCSARRIYYAIRQPARTACVAGVHTLQTSSSHRRALTMRALSQVELSAWCVRIKRKSRWWISYACPVMHAGSFLVCLSVREIEARIAHDWRFESAAVTSQRPNLLTSAPYGLWPYLKSLNCVLSHLTWVHCADCCTIASEIVYILRCLGSKTSRAKNNYIGFLRCLILVSFFLAPACSSICLTWIWAHTHFWEVWKLHLSECKCTSMFGFCKLWKRKHFLLVVGVNSILIFKNNMLFIYEKRKDNRKESFLWWGAN